MAVVEWGILPMIFTLRIFGEPERSHDRHTIETRTFSVRSNSEAILLAQRSLKIRKPERTDEISLIDDKGKIIKRWLIEDSLLRGRSTKKTSVRPRLSFFVMIFTTLFQSPQN